MAGNLLSLPASTTRALAYLAISTANIVTTDDAMLLRRDAL